MNWRVVLLLTVILSGAMRCEAAEPVDGFVRRALTAGLAGDSDRRRDLLRQALAVDPNAGPPNWHLGRIRIDDHWRTIPEAELRAMEDQLAHNYLHQRAALAGTMNGEARLASWCGRNGLTKQAYAHWYQVLRYNPTHKGALRGLDARWYGGVLLKSADVDRQKELAKRLKEELTEAEERVAAWRRAFTEGGETEREAALRDLSELRGPNAIPVIIDTLMRPTDDKRTNNAMRAHAMSLIGQLDDARSTPILAWHASNHADELVREAARRQLNKRPWHEFMPVLLAGMQMPLKVTSDTELTGRRIKTTFTFEQEGPEGRVLSNRRAATQIVPGKMHLDKWMLRQTL